MARLLGTTWTQNSTVVLILTMVANYLVDHRPRVPLSIACFRVWVSISAGYSENPPALAVGSVKIQFRGLG
jgi:hypothetical protein